MKNRIIYAAKFSLLFCLIICGLNAMGYLINFIFPSIGYHFDDPLVIVIFPMILTGSILLLVFVHKKAWRILSAIQFLILVLVLFSSNIDFYDSILTLSYNMVFASVFVNKLLTHSIDNKFAIFFVWLVSASIVSVVMYSVERLMKNVRLVVREAVHIAP